MVDSDSWITQFRKGLLELCLLNLLSGQDLYGYEMIKELTEISKMAIKGGTVYPILSRLKKDGLVSTELRESDRGPVRKYYRLTKNGRIKTTKMNDDWKIMSRSMNQLIKGSSL